MVGTAAKSEFRWRGASWPVLAILWLLVAAVFATLMLVVPDLSEGVRYLDRQLTGYEIEDVRAFLFDLGDDERAAYLMPYLLLDAGFAILLPLTLCLTSLSCLLRIEPLTGRPGSILPALALVMPVLAGLFDLWENWQHMHIIQVGMQVGAAMVEDASRATTFKLGFYIVSFLAMSVCLCLLKIHPIKTPQS